MRSVIKTNDLKEGIKYPCLMTASDDFGIIVVLFNNQGRGVVMHSEREGQPVGYYSEAWVMPCFEPFNGTIQLTNN